MDLVVVCRSLGAGDQRSRAGSRFDSGADASLTLVLSEARICERRRVCAMLRRAFDKTVSTWALAIAVDAGPMQIQLWEGAVLRCAGDCATESNSRHNVPISWLA